MGEEGTNAEPSRLAFVAVGSDRRAIFSAVATIFLVLGCEFQPFDVSSGSTSGSAQHSHSAPMPAMTRRATSFETPTLATKRTAPYNAKSAQIRSPSLESFYAGERDDTDWSKGAERAAAAPDALSEAPTPRRDAKDEALEEEFRRDAKDEALEEEFSDADGHATDEDECEDVDDSAHENTSAPTNSARPSLHANDTEQSSAQENAALPPKKRARPATHLPTSHLTCPERIMTQTSAQITHYIEMEEAAVAWFRSLVSDHFLSADLPAPMCDNSWSIAEHERTALDIIAGAAWI